MAWSNMTATDLSRQFVTLGSLGITPSDVDFVLSVDEAHPIVISDVATPFLTITDTPSETP